MSQNIFATIDPSISGDDLATVLNDFKDAIVSGCSGTSRPPNIQAGGAWIDTTNDPTSWAFKIFTGSTDILVFTVDLVNGQAASSQALDSFSVKHIAADTAGAILALMKERIANNGQVLSGDVVGEIRITGRTDSSTNPVVAKIVFTATDDMTTSAAGGTLSFLSTADATNALVEHMRFINGMVETVLPLKANSLVLVGQNVATAAAIAQLDASKVLVEMTGSTATDIQGINSGGATKTVVVHNRSTVNVTLRNQNAGAIAADRIKLPGGVDYVILPDSTVTLYYCTTDVVWKLLSDFASSGNVTKNSYFGLTQQVAIPNGVTVVTATAYRRQSGLMASQIGLLDTFGNAYAWGLNANGQLGVGDATNRSSPIAVLGGLQFLRAIGAQGSDLGLAINGNLYAWGVNANGQLGLGDVTPRSSPVAVLGGFKFLSAYQMDTSAFALSTGGSAYAWGINTNGQLGIGDVIPRSSPIAVLGGFKFVKLAPLWQAAGQSSVVGLTVAGALYAWGQNTNGQLGVGDVTPRSSPIAVLGGLTFSKVIAVGSSASGPSFIGLDTSGNAYGWGSNLAGQLGVGDRSSRSSPVAVLGGFKFTQIFAPNPNGGGTASVYATTSDGTLYAWGENDAAQLGVGDLVNRSSPVAVLGGLKFLKVTPSANKCAFAITSEGIAYAWGQNAVNGQLGVGDLVNRSSPVAVLGGFKWADITSPNDPGDPQASFGVTPDGSLYSWGANSKGTLGLGDVTSRSSPVAVLGTVSSDAHEIVSCLDLTVTGGQTYTVGTGDGGAYFGSTPLGRDVYRVDIEYFS